MGPALRGGWYLAAAIAAILIGTTVYVVHTTEHPPRAHPGGATGAFDKDGGLDPSIRRALYSPDGARLAVLAGGGVGLAGGGQARLVSQGNVVDASWMPDARALLVVEGPAVADRLTEIDLSGKVIGVAHLDAPFSVGYGRGLSVDTRGTRAVVTTETRDPIGGRQRTDIDVVDLATGHVTPVTHTPDADEAWPQFVDDTHIVFARNDAVIERTLADGRERVLSAGGERAYPVGVAAGGIVVYQATAPGHVDLIAILADGHHQRLRRLGRGTSVVTVNPSATQAVAARGCCDSLRMVTLAPPRRVG